MKTTRILVVATCGLLVALIAVSAYAYRTRNIAINGWAAWSKAQSELEQLRAKTHEGKSDAAEEKYRALWSTVLGLEIEDDLTFAVAASNYLHRRIPMGTEDTSGSIPARLMNALAGKGEQALCGDYSAFLQMVLQASGIPSRTVQLAAQEYVDGIYLGPTHVTVEMMHNGKWIIVDPTFDAIFSCGGNSELIGVDEARLCSDLVANQHSGTLPGRSVAEHNAKYSDLLAYSASAETWVGDEKIEWQSYPDRDWLPKANALQRRNASSNSQQLAN